MNKQPFKRRIYLIDPPFQYGLIRKIAILAGLMIVVSLSFLAIMYHTYGDIQVVLIQPDPFAQLEGVNTIEQRKSLMDLLWPVLGICLLVTLGTTFIYGILISHRMAGPIYRIRLVLGDMARGDLRDEIRLRKKDEFKSLAESINDLKRSWRLSLAEMQALIDEIERTKTRKRKDLIENLKIMLLKFNTD